MAQPASAPMTASSVPLVSSVTPEFVLGEMSRFPLNSTSLKRIENIVNEVIENAEKSEPSPLIEKKLDNIRVRAEEINNEIWVKASFIERAKWYLSKILGSWSPCASKIQFFDTSRYMEHVKLFSDQKKLQQFLKDSDRTILMNGDRGNIQERLKDFPAGTCAVIADPKGTSNTFLLFVVDSRQTVQEIPLQLKDTKVNARFAGKERSFTTIQELVNHICNSATPRSLIFKEAEQDAAIAQVESRCEEFCKDKEVYQNEQAAQAAFDEIQRNFPACKKLKNFAIYKNDQDEYRVLIWDPQNKQFLKVALDVITTPGTILFRLDNQKESPILKRCSPHELESFFARECGRDIDKDMAQQFQAQDDFRTRFQDQMLIKHELFLEDSRVNQLRLKVDEKFKKICSTSSYLLLARSDKEHPDETTFTLFTHQPKSRLTMRSAQTVMRRVTILPAGKIQVQEMADTGRVKVNVKPQIFDSLDAFAQHLKSSYKSSLKEEMINKLTPLLKKLSNHEETFREIISDMPEEDEEYTVSVLTANRKRLENLRAAIQKDCAASGTLWKVPDLIKKIDLEMNTVKLREKIATAFKAFKKVTEASNTTYVVLEQAKAEVMKILLQTGNPTVSSMSKEERLKIYKSCEELYKEASLRLLPDYVEEEVPKLLKQAEESLHSTNANDIAKQKQAIESVIGMLKALEKYYPQDVREAIASFKEKREALEAVLSQIATKLEALKRESTGASIHLSHVSASGPLVVGSNNVTINYYGDQRMGGQSGAVANSVAGVAQRIFNPLSIAMVLAQASFAGISLPLAFGTYVASSVVTEGIRYMQPNMDPRLMQLVSPLLAMGGSIVYNQLRSSLTAEAPAAVAPSVAPRMEAGATATTRTPTQPMTSVQTNPFYNVREPTAPTITASPEIPVSVASMPQMPFTTTPATADALFLGSVWDYAPSGQTIKNTVQIATSLTQLGIAVSRGYATGDVIGAVSGIGLLMGAARTSAIYDHQSIVDLPLPRTREDRALEERLANLG